MIAAAALPLAAVLISSVAIGFLTSGRAAASKDWTWSEGPHSLVKRTEVAAAQVGRSIYVLGGFLPPDRTTAIVERYDIDARRWTRVRPLPVPLNHAAAVGHGGFVYVLGGYASRTGLTQAVATLYRYDPRRDRWAALPPAFTRRAALALGALGGKLYAAGGANESGALDTLEVYDIRRRTWSRGPRLSVPREHLGGATTRAGFYAVAGRNASGNLKIVERYTPGRGWRRMPDVETPRGGNGAAGWPGGGRVFAVGGEGPGGTIRQVEAFDGRSWERLPDLPTPRHGLGVVFDAAGRRLYVLEGGVVPGFSFSDRLEVLRRRP